jgi:hypothetical protein
VEIKNITVYVSGYTETDTTGMLSLPIVWRQQSEFISSRQSGQILAAVRIGFQCHCNGQSGYRFKRSHTFLQCIPRQMLVCCVVSVLTPMYPYPNTQAASPFFCFNAAARVIYTKITILARHIFRRFDNTLEFFLCLKTDHIYAISSNGFPVFQYSV